jgi:hypothetical protein
LTTEVTIICDGCGQPILPEEGHEHVQIHAHEVDHGQGITSAPAHKDYHPGCLPTEPTPVARAVGYEHGNLIGKHGVTGREKQP